MKNTNLTRISTASGLFAAAVLFLLLGGVGAITDPWRFDESFSWYVVHLPWGAMWDKIAGDVHPPLYYWLLAGWVKLWPEPGSMKAFSLVAGLIATLTAGAAGMLISGKRAGIYTALLWATFPQFLHFSQDARMYSLALCFEALALLGWAIAFRRPVHGWMMMTASLVCALYTQNLCLFFAAALLGGEAVRLVAARLARAPRQAMNWRWLAGAVIACALLYMPWLPFLDQQRHYGPLLALFVAPHADSAVLSLLHYAYMLGQVRTDSVISWIPPAIMLCALPPASLILRKPPRSDGPVPPGWMPLVLAIGPLALLLSYSILIQPIIAIERHGVLFLPFLLFGSATALDRLFLKGWGRVGPILVVAVLGNLAVCLLSGPRDPDYRPVIDSVLKRAPVDLPILTQPVTFDEGRLEWVPLPVLTVGQMDGLERVTACTLVIGRDSNHTEGTVVNSARSVIERANQVVEIYRSNKASAYALRGLPRGALAALVGRTAKTPRTRFTEIMGDFEPETFCGGNDLAALCNPPAEPHSESVVGARLMAPQTRLTIAPPHNDGICAIALGTQMLGRCDPGSVSVQYGNRAPVPISGKSNGLAIELADASRPPRQFVIRIPSALASAEKAPTGDSPDGFYINWSAGVTLMPEWFRRKDWDGTCFRIGVSYDAMFTRRGFNEREGAGASSCRWTQREFTIELPVWAGTRPAQLALWCSAPAQIKSRTVSLKVWPLDVSAGPPVAVANGKVPGGKFDSYTFNLSAPLEPGLYRFEFSLDGDFVPCEHSLGRDSRRLGLLLNAVGLR